jgi:uncharacterized protein (TIGR02246 family)
MRQAMSIVLICLISFCTGKPACATDQAKAKEAIEKSIQSYIAAFNAGDSKKLASHWAPDAVYINPLTGMQVEGREAIAREMAANMKELKGFKLLVDVKSIQFISPGVAVEQGTSNLISPAGKAQDMNYTAVHVKQNGHWFLDRITEEEIPVILSNYEHLKELEWLIGDWTDSDEAGSVQTTCQWTKNKNFIIRQFAASTQNRIDLSGMQIIGWDPANKQIRSWVFDSDGGFSEGKWTKKKKQWYVMLSGTLPDGRKTSSTNIYKIVDQNHFKWQSVNRIVDGELQPNINEVTVVRDEAVE